MDPNVTQLERAFALAQSGECQSIPDLMRAMRAEGYLTDQIEGPILIDQLRKLIQSTISPLGSSTAHRQRDRHDCGRSNPLTRKLRAFSRLSQGDCLLLDKLLLGARTIAARTDLFREGERPTNVPLVVEGIACRYQPTPDGRRQITGFLVPGDLADLHAPVLDQADHNLETLTSCRIASVPHARIVALLARETLARALWTSELISAATLRTWLVSLGRRSAEERMAHLFCELGIRLRAVGEVEDEAVRLPLKQRDIADAIGITIIHTNRVLQLLQKRGLVALGRRSLTIIDLGRLIKASRFDAGYLHLEAVRPDMRQLSLGSP